MHKQDLDLMTTAPGRGSEMEIYDHDHAWPEASSPIYIETNRYRGGVYQLGYDPATDQHWMRVMAEGTWSPWAVFPPVVVPPPGKAAAAAAPAKKR